MISALRYGQPCQPFFCFINCAGQSWDSVHKPLFFSFKERWAEAESRTLVLPLTSRAPYHWAKPVKCARSTYGRRGLHDAERTRLFLHYAEMTPRYHAKMTPATQKTLLSVQKILRCGFRIWFILREGYYYYYYHLLKAYSTVKRTGSPRGFSLNQKLRKLNTIQNMHILQT